MGQYHQPYNLTKKETIHPHAFGDGLKLLEWGSGGDTTAALVLLLANSNGRGGGDLYFDESLGMPKETFDSIVGRWAGDSIAVIGDYADDAPDDNEYTDISSEVLAVMMHEPAFRKKMVFEVRERTFHIAMKDSELAVAYFKALGYFSDEIAKKLRKEALNRET